MLTSCSPTIFNSKSCGVLLPYSEEALEETRKELKTLEKEKYPRIWDMIRGYAVTRDTIKDCLEGR